MSFWGRFTSWNFNLVPSNLILATGSGSTLSSWVSKKSKLFLRWPVLIKTPYCRWHGRPVSVSQPKNDSVETPAANFCILLMSLEVDRSFILRIQFYVAYLNINFIKWSRGGARIFLAGGGEQALPLEVATWSPRKATSHRNNSRIEKDNFS